MPRSVPGETARGRVAAVDRDGRGFLVHLWVEDSLRAVPTADPAAEELRPGDLAACGPESLELYGRAGATGGDVLRWRLPGAAGTRLAGLRRRHAVTRAARAFFDAGFLEIPAPVLLAAPNPEPQFHLVDVPGAFGSAPGVLSTSPELQLKRLLVGGAERVYSLGPVFRGRETDATHNPEFWMLEWYRAWTGLDAMADDLENLVAACLPHAALDGGGRVSRGGRRIALAPPWPRRTVGELVGEGLGVDLSGCVEAGDLFERGRRGGFFTDADPAETFEQLFSRLWAGLEGGIGTDGPVLVCEWPAPLASLARLKPGDPAVAERMELVVDGLELANGFAELTDAAEYRRRFAASNTERARRGLPVYPVDETFLAAVEAGLPPSSGMALGFDRLCMLLAGAADLRAVLPFTADEL